MKFHRRIYGLLATSLFIIVFTALYISLSRTALFVANLKLINEGLLGNLRTDASRFFSKMGFHMSTLSATDFVQIAGVGQDTLQSGIKVSNASPMLVELSLERAFWRSGNRYMLIVRTIHSDEPPNVVLAAQWHKLLSARDEGTWIVQGYVITPTDQDHRLLISENELEKREGEAVFVQKLRATISPKLIYAAAVIIDGQPKAQFAVFRK